jgi:hypothetical protein
MTSGELNMAVAIGGRSSFCGSASMLENLVTLVLVSSGLQQGTFGDAIFFEATV